VEPAAAAVDGVSKHPAVAAPVARGSQSAAAAVVWALRPEPAEMVAAAMPRGRPAQRTAEWAARAALLQSGRRARCCTATAKAAHTAVPAASSATANLMLARVAAETAALARLAFS